MNLFDKIFGRMEKGTNPSVKHTEQSKISSFEEFASLSADNRIRKIMVLGDSGKSEHFSILEYAILNDSDQNVRFAALKRIDLFKEHPGLIPMLNELKSNGMGEKLEPYYSMALSKLGLITLQEYEEKLNNSK